MDRDTIGLITLIVAILSGPCSVIAALMFRGADRNERNTDVTSRRIEKTGDRQGSISESLAALAARTSAMEEAYAKVADALQRIVRLEEWRGGVEPRIDEADQTSRAVITLVSENKTIFKRMDATDRKIDEQSDKMDALPRQTAELLRTMIRPIEPARAAHG